MNGYIHCRSIEDFKHDLQQRSIHSLAASTEYLCGYIQPCVRTDKKKQFSILRSFFLYFLVGSEALLSKGLDVFRRYMKHVVEGLVPDVYSVVPVGHITMLNGIL